MKLYRVEGRIDGFADSLDPKIKERLDQEIRGRWFSDDLAYIYASYYKPGMQWTCVEVPDDICESSRYERAKEENPNLYGVEGKDFFLPREWADKRIPIDPPERKCGQTAKTITEITSNMARLGAVLDYDKTTGWATVVVDLSPGFATLRTTNKRMPGYIGLERLVPVRQVTSIWQATSTQ